MSQQELESLKYLENSELEEYQTPTSGKFVESLGSLLSVMVVMALAVGGGYWFYNNGESVMDSVKKQVDLREVVTNSSVFGKTREEIMFQRELNDNERRRDMEWHMEQRMKNMPTIDFNVVDP